MVVFLFVFKNEKIHKKLKIAKLKTLNFTKSNTISVTTKQNKIKQILNKIK